MTCLRDQEGGWGARGSARKAVCRALGLLSISLVALVSAAQPEASPQPGLGAVPSHRQANNVAIITIDDIITKVTVFSFQRRLQIAEESGADAVVVELDTPGGEVGSVIEICDLIRSSTIGNIVAWVHSEAHSGGAIIALACKEIVTDQSVKFGDALPIRMDQISQFQSMDQAERQKITAPLIGEVVSSARLRGWDEFIVQGFVALGVELWWVRDTQTGDELAINEAEYRMLFDGEPPRSNPIHASAMESGGVGATEEGAESPAAAPIDDAEFIPAGPALAQYEVESYDIGAMSNRPTISEGDRGRYELIGYLSTGDGPMEFNAAQLALLGFASNVDESGALDPIRNDADLAKFFGAQNVKRLDSSWSERMVAFLTHPIPRGVLIVVFLLALFLEMSHPGVGLPGIVAVIALLTLLAPPALIGMANWWEIGAIVVGILLIFAEIFVIPGFGVAGISGLLALFGGLLGTFVGETGGIFPDSPTEQTNLMYGLVTITLSTVTAGVGIYYLAKHFGSVPLLGKLVLKDVSGQPSETDGDPLLAAMPGHEEPLPAVGVEGVTITPLRPAGRAEIGGRIFDVVADLGFIDADAGVRVLSADTFRVVVVPLQETEQEEG